jgi:hypothetical protein
MMRKRERDGRYLGMDLNGRSNKWTGWNSTTWKFMISKSPNTIRIIE